MTKRWAQTPPRFIPSQVGSGLPDWTVIASGTFLFLLPAIRSTRLNLAAEQISTVLLAAGYRPHHPWLRLPITEQDGSIKQYRGVTSAPGVYVVGQRFQHRRDSAMIDGARHDAQAVVSHLRSGSLEPVSIGRVPR